MQNSTMNILDKIVRDKKEEIAQELEYISTYNIGKSKQDSRLPLDFRTALQTQSLAVIAEVKKASPSKGLIRPDFNPQIIARSYADAGANCLSVLTEKKYFQGHPDYLKAIRQGVELPILRKDFIVDVRQIRESYEMGADAILLIASILSNEQISTLLALANDFGLTVLVEVHSDEDLSRVLSLNCPLIGINNRNLATFKTDILHSVRLKERIPEDTVCVSESGIKTAMDCKILKESGFDAILVGETLMRQPDPGAHISILLSETT